MRSYRYLLLCIALFLCLHSVAAVPQHALRRQDDGTPEQTDAPSGTIAISERPSATSIAQSADESRASSTVSASATSTGSPANSSIVSPTSVEAGAPTASSARSQEHVLPIQPSLTPAMGVSGVLLLITGLVYAAYGIKNKWYVFPVQCLRSSLPEKGLCLRLSCLPDNARCNGPHRLPDESSRVECDPRRFLRGGILYRSYLWRSLARFLRHHRRLWMSSWWLLS